MRVTCGKCGARFPVLGVVTKCPRCEAELPDSIVKVMEGDPSAVMDLEFSAMMDHMQAMMKASPVDRDSLPLASTLKTQQDMPGFVTAMLNILKGKPTPDECKLYTRQMLSMCLQTMVDHGGENPVVEFKKIIMDWFEKNLPGVEPPYIKETLLKVPLRDLPLGSYAIYEGREVWLATRVKDGDNAGVVGLCYQDTKELKDFLPDTEVVPFQYKGKT